MAVVVSAGPDRTLCLPATDISLFGTARDSITDLTQVCAWSQVSGPSTAVFSAPWAEITTAGGLASGTYVFRLTSGATTDDTTVTVVAESSQTKRYVDPTYNGGAGASDGSATKPWTTLFGDVTSAWWVDINTQLASNHVIVYYSARQAGSDTAETINDSAQAVWRTDTSTHHLTIDGMSMYNTNDSSGLWATYTGTNKFHLNNTASDIAIGVRAEVQSWPYSTNYTTIRGFDTTGTFGGRVLACGDYFTWEYIDVHDTTQNGGALFLNAAVEGQQASGGAGPAGTVSISGTTVTGVGTNFLSGNGGTGWINVGGAIQANGEVRFVATVPTDTSLTVTSAWTTPAGPGLSYTTARKEFGNHNGMTVRHCTVTDGNGEGIYIAGTYARVADSGAPIWGNTHTNILVESNTVTRADAHGGQGDGIDLKCGLINVAVRNNLIQGAVDASAYGITTIGIFNGSSVNSHVLIEQNTIISAGATDIGGIGGTDVSGIIVRNNVIKHGGIYFPGFVLTGNYNIVVENNTSYDYSTYIVDAAFRYGFGIGISDVTNAYIRNNLMALSASGPAALRQLNQSGSNSGIDSDYNIIVTGVTIDSWPTLGAHDVSYAVGTSFFVGPGANNFHLDTSSPAIDIGLNLSSSFNNDRDSVIRPYGLAWDIGAYEFQPSTYEIVTIFG